jgi:hypothetical protein
MCRKIGRRQVARRDGNGRVERRRILRGARGKLARLARRSQNEDEEMGDTDVKKKK